MMKPQITVWRTQRGLTQRDVALAIGCARSALSAWETGIRLVPSWYLWKLARCLAVPVDALYELDDTDTEAPQKTPRGRKAATTH